ncbi:hypothetical protein GCM10011348_46040 [Marinobacterium nitratireducens]|uniref:Phage shock protein B n=1 Tax=Marinobacterium nitratireducens TaxID=518897 RepID=A0A918DXE1_9GAMM|nr:hypothetical protein [Marinobacterium nitratireducens]GGO89094.1 hypothetical protein GCM10011348_46040 [Marinobacterium nitratireducens]
MIEQVIPIAFVLAIGCLFAYMAAFALGVLPANKRARPEALKPVAVTNEHHAEFASSTLSMLRLQQQEQSRLVAENEELRARINRVEEWLAKVEAKVDGGAA